MHRHTFTGLFLNMTTDKVLKPPRLIPSTRFTLAFLVSLALFAQYAQRVGLAMGIVCMVDRTKQKVVSNITLTSTISKSITQSHKYGSEILQDKSFVFSEFQQQILLGAHWFGYILTLTPGGWIAMKIGAKKVFALGILVSSTATLAMVTIYYLDDLYFISAVIFRIVTGLGHGPLFPASYVFWSMWAVPLERSTLTSIGFCTTNLGTSLTMLLGGLLCRYVTSGWVYIFLFTSILGFLWLPFWLWLVADSPQTHRSISEQERKYVCDGVGIGDKDQKPRSVSFASLPWKRVFRSKPVIALAITQFCNLFGLFFFYTNVGKLLTEIHHVPPQYAGYVLAGGFIFMPVVSLSTGILADNLVRRNIMTLTNVRKLFNSLTSFTSAACMIILCFCDQTRQTLGVMTVFLFLVVSAMAYGSGYVVNFADVVPAYSSIIFSVSSAVGTVGALVSNLVAGIIIKRPVLEDWRKLLFLFAILYTIGGLVYVLYGSAVPRKWARLTSEKTKEPEEDPVLTAVSSQTDIPNIIKETQIN